VLASEHFSRPLKSKQAQHRVRDELRIDPVMRAVRSNAIRSLQAPR
jgi:hypothetical protein